MTPRSSAKRPAEVFGYAIENNSPEAQRDRQRHWCPFVGKQCSKKSRDIDYPFGVCSVRYGGETVAICPVRFRQSETALTRVADHYFGTRHDLIAFSEVSIRARVKSGRTVQYTFDYVLVKHKPLSTEIEDFVVVEFQTVDTTSTGKLRIALEEFVTGESIQDRSYGFGLNWANVWKRCFTQILRKGTIVENWGHKIYWVAQEPAYRHLVDGYGLYDLSYDPVHATVFTVYDLEQGSDGYTLAESRIESSTIEGLFDAFRNNTPIPPKAAFIQSLEDRVRDEQSGKMRLKLEID
jgi:restriction endonuclease NotI